MKNKAPIIIGALAIGGALIFAIAQGAKAAPPPQGYVCPYCGATFNTYEELAAHVLNTHPTERVPIDIYWE